MAWWMTFGVEWPTRNLEIMSRSNSILIMNLLELITNGTSGLSNARVDEDKAASTAEVKNWTEDSLMYVTEDCRTLAGTNADARLCG